jgi:hypothetical protein
MGTSPPRVVHRGPQRSQGLTLQLAATIVHPARARVHPTCTRACAAVADLQSARGRQGRIGVDRLKNRRRGLLNARERLRKRLAVAAIEVDVIA